MIEINLVKPIGKNWGIECYDLSMIRNLKSIHTQSQNAIDFMSSLSAVLMNKVNAFLQSYNDTDMPYIFIEFWHINEDLCLEAAIQLAKSESVKLVMEDQDSFYIKNHS